jgi:hypothetical protein
VIPACLSQYQSWSWSLIGASVGSFMFMFVARSWKELLAPIALRFYSALGPVPGTCFKSPLIVPLLNASIALLDTLDLLGLNPSFDCRKN